MKLLYILLIFLQIGIYQPAEQPTYEFKSVSGIQSTEQTSGNKPSGPRKVSGLGWLDWYVWGQYNGVPKDASNEDMYAYYQYVRNGGTKTWEEFFTPIGDISFVLLLMFVAIYIVFKKCRYSDYYIYITQKFIFFLKKNTKNMVVLDKNATKITLNRHFLYDCVKIELYNKFTKKTLVLDNLRDVSESEYFYEFEGLDLSSLTDGQYTISLYDDESKLIEQLLGVCGDYNKQITAYQKQNKERKVYEKS